MISKSWSFKYHPSLRIIMKSAVDPWRPRLATLPCQMRFLSKSVQFLKRVRASKTALRQSKQHSSTAWRRCIPTSTISFIMDPIQSDTWPSMSCLCSTPILTFTMYHQSSQSWKGSASSSSATNSRCHLRPLMAYCAQEAACPSWCLFLLLDTRSFPMWEWMDGSQEIMQLPLHLRNLIMPSIEVLWCVEWAWIRCARYLVIALLDRWTLRLSRKWS